MSATVSASPMGRSEKITTLTRLKMAVFTPMASASVMVETAANDGLFISERTPYRKSWRTVSMVLLPRVCVGRACLGRGRNLV
jgi:hypothetical protein